jgi:hypothetical protein
MIDLTKLTREDIGREVIFRGEKRGTIFSYSKSSIEVDYPPNRGTVLTRPEDLDFVDNSIAG